MTVTPRVKTRRKNYNLKMISRESVREYLTRAKGLAAAVRYHGAEITEKQFASKILTVLPSCLSIVRDVHTMKMNYSLAEIEHAVIKTDEFNEQPDASDGHALARGAKTQVPGRARRGQSGKPRWWPRALR